MTSSKDAATYFGKQHAHVLWDIDTLISQEPSIASSFGANEGCVTVGFGTRKVRTYDMNRDGFTLLAMGFTGPRALKFKLAYIAESMPWRRDRTRHAAPPPVCRPTRHQIHVASEWTSSSCSSARRAATMMGARSDTTTARGSEVSNFTITLNDNRMLKILMN